MQFKKTVLSNGLRVVTAPQKGSPAVTVLILVEAGSEYEAKEINGLSHFLEHLCFKGTKKRPRAIDITSELDGIGSIYNAFTGNEYTGYFAKADSRHFDKILDVVSDMYLNPIFDPAEIDKERGVIIEEINMYEDLPMRRVQEVFTELLYGDQPAGWDIAGRKEVIGRLIRDDFVSYRNRHYLATSTVVVVAGAINEKEVVDKVKKTFLDIAVGEKTVKPRTEEFQEEPGILVKHKDSDQTHLVLGIRGYDIFDHRRHTLGVIADILGGGMSSRLWQKIRDQMGAAYYVRAGSDLFSDHGYLEASAGVDNRRVKEVIEAILGELRRLRVEPIPANELQRAKDHLIGNLMLSLETSDALAGFYGMQEIITREILTPEEIADKIRSVTHKNIIEVTRDIFSNNKLNLALIGPGRMTAQLREILKIG